MIVPNFSITQDDAFVYVHINVPYVRVGAAEMVCDQCKFSFWCKPYLLKLTFPHPLDGTDEERCRATHDPSQAHGTLIAHLPKMEPGLHFPDLDLTTTLMQVRGKGQLGAVTTGAKQKQQQGVPAIQVLSSTDHGTATANDNSDGLTKSTTPGELFDIDAIDFEKEMSLETEADIALRLPGNVFYGFNRKYSKVLGRFREEFVDVLEVPDPDETAENMRRSMRIISENALFDPERYLGDLCDAPQDGLYQCAMQMVPWWVRCWEHWQAAVRGAKESAEAGSSAPSSPPSTVASFDSDEGGGGFSEKDSQVIARDIGNREFFINHTESQALLLGLVDLLFSYCYDVRCTEGEYTVESAHNITRLSPTLSWLDRYSEQGDDSMLVICSLMRRLCIYPYMRNWKLGRKVLADVARILYLGKRCILKCLLGIRAIFHSTDTHYMLNTVYVDDYCCWIQTVDEEALQAFARQYNAAKTSFEKSSTGKGAVGLQLVELESWLQKQDQFGDVGVAAGDEEPSGSESESESESESNSESDSDDDKDDDDSSVESIGRGIDGNIDCNDDNNEEASEQQQGQAMSLPKSFSAANRNAATAHTILEPSLRPPQDSPEGSCLSEMLSGMGMALPAAVPATNTLHTLQSHPAGEPEPEQAQALSAMMPQVPTLQKKEAKRLLIQEISSSSVTSAPL